MKKRRVVIVFLFIMVMFCFAKAESYVDLEKLTKMSIEELQALQQQISEVINEKKIAGATLSIEFPSSILAMGKTMKPSVLCDGREITKQTQILFESSDITVAEITKNNEIKGNDVGNVHIHAKAIFEDGAILETDKELSVVMSVNAVIVPAKIEMLAGEKMDISDMIKIAPDNATNKQLHYTVDNESLAAIDDNGLLTALHGGNVTIIIQSLDETTNVKAQKCSVKINEPVESIILSEKGITIGKGKTITLVADVMPESATNKAVAWSVGDSTIASVSQAGVVTGLKKGKTVIKCEAKDGSGVKASAGIVVVDFQFRNAPWLCSKETVDKGENGLKIWEETHDNYSPYVNMSPNDYYYAAYYANDFARNAEAQYYFRNNQLWGAAYYLKGVSAQGVKSFMKNLNKEFGGFLGTDNEGEQRAAFALRDFLGACYPTLNTYEYFGLDDVTDRMCWIDDKAIVVLVRFGDSRCNIYYFPPLSTWKEHGLY